jgi:hypothetical protein
MANMEMQRRLAAYHEAGHAVAAHELYCRINAVTIVPSKSHSGRLIYQSLLARVDIEFEVDRDKVRRNYGRLEDTIVIALAGPFAQRHHAPRSRWRVGGGIVKGMLDRGTDFDVVSGLIFKFYGNAAVAKAYWEYVKARTESFVDGHWPRIDAVAECLLERGTISHDELREAINRKLMS